MPNDTPRPETTDIASVPPSDELGGVKITRPKPIRYEGEPEQNVPQVTEALTRVAFAGLAARVAQRAAQWAADCAQYPRPERQGEPMERAAALRFCTSIEELLTVIKEDARG